jgi:hypothetical protein
MKPIRGTNGHKVRYEPYKVNLIYGIIFITATVIYSRILIADPPTVKAVSENHVGVISSLPLPAITAVEEARTPLRLVAPKPTQTPLSIQHDIWIGEAADKFANNKKSASDLRYQLHCLANKESKHGVFQTCGDSGKSCGLYQYREATWSSFRKTMLAKGLISELSTRWNDKEAIFTTAWALAQGKDMNWGPIKNKGNCL